MKFHRTMSCSLTEDDNVVGAYDYTTAFAYVR